MPIFELNPYTPNLGVNGELLSIATEPHGVIRVDRVDVVALPHHAEFDLSLIDFEDYGNETLIQQISQPRSGEAIPVQKTAHHQLSYRLSCSPWLRGEPFQVNIVYELLPRIAPAPPL